MGALEYRSDIFTTLTGRRVRLVDPWPSDVCLADIAGALARVCRFGGHCPGHMSVAVHSVLVSKIVEDLGGSLEQQLAGLLHDAAEAYVGDMVTALKQHDDYFQGIEQGWQIAIGQAFGLGDALLDHEGLVKQADRMAFDAEWRDCFPDREPCVGANPTPRAAPALPASRAEELFLLRYAELAQALGGRPLAMLG